MVSPIPWHWATRRPVINGTAIPQATTMLLRSRRVWSTTRIATRPCTCVTDHARPERRGKIACYGLCGTRANAVAAQARRIATMLPIKNAELIEAFAKDCEEPAQQMVVDGIRFELRRSFGPPCPRPRYAGCV